MKQLIYILFIFISINTFAQNTKVIYQLETNFTEKQLNENYIGDYLKNIQKAAHAIDFQLIYSDTVANYSIVEKNVADENYTAAVNFSGGTAKNYIINTKNYKYTANEFGFKKNQFLIESNITKNWTITKDTLQVNGYKCFKAIKTLVQKIENNIITHNTTAWFCPEITSKYGPNCNGGLPGLILFLEENGMVYKMKSIQFNSKEKLEIPSLKNIISEDVYNEKLMHFIPDNITD